MLYIKVNEDEHEQLTFEAWAFFSVNHFEKWPQWFKVDWLYYSYVPSIINLPMLFLTATYLFLYKKGVTTDTKKAIMVFV